MVSDSLFPPYLLPSLSFLPLISTLSFFFRRELGRLTDLNRANLYLYYKGYIDPESDGSLEEDLAARRYRALLPDDDDYDSDDY